jgi:hypothetical protein
MRMPQRNPERWPLFDAGRVRLYTGNLALWNNAPLNDTPQAGAALRRRLGY